MASISTLDEKFTHELGDIYDAEHRFLEGQQEMLESASSNTVKVMLQEHIAQTEQQIKNLEQVFQALGQKAKRVSCDAAAGLVTEARKTIKEASSSPALTDCVIVGAASKVEHYEIASYRGLISGAQLMNQTEVLQLLQQNLQQEEQTAQKLEQATPQLLQQAMASAASA